MKRDAPEEDGDAQNESTGENNNNSQSNKRQRVFSSEAVLVDEFEREAKREVPASAGLTGTVEVGQRLELRHQVRCVLRSLFSSSIDLLLLRFDTK